MSGPNRAREFAEAVIVAYPKESEQWEFCRAWANLAGRNEWPSIKTMHALLACEEVSFSLGTTRLTPPCGDPDGPADAIDGGEFTWQFRHLTITLYSDGTWLADEDPEVTL